MISIIQSGPEYEIRFPYNDVLVDWVKMVPGRRWHPEGKFWTVPKDKIGFFLNYLKGTSFEQQLKIESNEDLGINQKMEDTPRYSIPDIDISDVKQYVKDGGKLYKHQEDCLKYSIGRKEKGNFNGFLLADEMGCLSGDMLVTIRINEIYCTDMTLEALYASIKRNDILLDGLEVLSLDGTEQKFYPVRCVLNQGEKECVCVNAQGMGGIVCTPDHEFLTDRGWVQAQDLAPQGNVKYIRASFPDGSCDWRLVESVYPVGTKQTYDIGINDSQVHWFICSDAVVHNCGKTLEVINLALFKKQYENAKHCLVLCCVNSAKYNWADDISVHTNGEYEGYILGSRVQRRKGTVSFNGSGKQKLEDLETGLMYSDKELNKPLPYFLILNIEALRTTDKSKKRNERNVLTRKLAEMCLDGKISMIAIDEIHRNASPQSEQGKQIMFLKKITGKRIEWIPMTGTPVVNKPTDVFLPMRLVEAHDCDSYWKWNQHYCIYGGYGGHNVMGYKNIPELKAVLEPNMLRRTKDQVLDLPGKIYHVEYIENSKVQQKLYAQVRDEMLSNVEEIQYSSNPLAKFLKLRQVNGCPEEVDDSIDPKSATYLSVNSKMKRLVELVQDVVDSGEKAVVFSNWIAPLRSAYRILHKKGFKVASYVGTMPQDEREENKRKFIEDPSVSVMIGTIGALGTSHTLSVASNVIFLDQAWNAATQEQAEDRCYRLNSSKPVNVYSLISKDTIDERVYDIIKRKKATSNYIVDNELNLRENPELIRYLLS